MEDYLKLIPCPTGCTVVYKGTNERPQMRKGEDYESYYFDVVDANGKVLSSHEVRESTSMYPPFGQKVYLHH